MTTRIGERMREEEKGATWHKWEELLVWVANERLVVVLVESLAAGVAPMQEEEVAVKERSSRWHYCSPWWDELEEMVGLEAHGGVVSGGGKNEVVGAKEAA